MNGFGVGGMGSGCGRGRNRKHRHIGFSHVSRFFKPSGIPVSDLEELVLLEEELESLRLKNLEGLDIISGADKMKISKSTFARIYNSAVIKISDALVNGKAIRIDK